ncbi:MAG TPA: hypothetical protein VMZ69_03985 [Saprospiraceae bacterium]|nr:hypothetical protein [Saprospiraceae bacterium]
MMKYFLTLVFASFITISANSQVWFDAGVKGAYGPTFMLDKNVFDDGDYKHKLTTGHSIGGRLGVNFGYHAGISLEYNASTGKQDFNVGSDLNRFKWKHNDILALFRYSGNGAYVELGGEYSIMGDVTLEKRRDGSVTNLDVSDKFVDNYKSAVFGFGSYLLGGDLFTVNLGIRLHFALDDMVNQAGKDEFYPFAQPQAQYDPTRKTRPVAAQLQIEANYAWGRFSKTACHDRWRLFLFQ